MSLTRLLKSNSKAGDIFRNIIDIVDINTEEILKEIKGANIIAPYILKNHTLAGQVGTAFDYLARFVIKHYQNKVNGICKEEVYVAEYGLNILLENTEIYPNNYCENYSNALDLINEYINGNDSKTLFERIIKIAVYFAKLESIYRNGYTEEKEFSLLYTPDIYVIKELKNQIEIFETAFEEKFKIKTTSLDIIYNPEFAKCSLAVGGADADIIINDTLIDFKSSKYLTSIKGDFKQIVGYFLFNNIVNKNREINKICLYFSRYGKFIEYEFTEKDKDKILIATEKMNEFINILLVCNR